MINLYSTAIYISILKTGLIILGATLALTLVKQGIRTLLVSLETNSHLTQTAHKQRIATIGSLLKNTAAFIVWSIAGTTILSIFNINIGPLLATAGVLGLAIGFGAQTLVRDMMTGLFLLAENYINIGDKVEIAGKKGKVVSIKLRTTIIKDESSHTTHIIPNSSITLISKFE